MILAIGGTALMRLNKTLLIAISFNTIRDKMPSERRERNELRTQAMLLGMALKEVRQARNLTQQQLASDLGVSQAAFSEMEDQGDIQISTLQRVLAAMWGLVQ